MLTQSTTRKQSTSGRLRASQRTHRMSVGELRGALADVPDWATAELEVLDADGYTTAAILADYGSGILNLCPTTGTTSVGELREALADVPDWATVDADSTGTGPELVDYGQGVLTLSLVEVAG